jgi:hypothetical protein
MVVNDGTPLPRSRPKRDYPIARGVAPPPGWRGRGADALPVYSHRASAENAQAKVAVPIVRPPEVPPSRHIGRVVLLGIGVLVLAVSVRVGFELTRLAKTQATVAESPPAQPPMVVASAAPQAADSAEPERVPAKPAEPAAVAAVPPGAKSEPRPPEPSRPAPNFAKDVQPIVTAKCITCHGKDNKKKGGLDLRTLDALHKGGESGQVVVRGELEKSLLWESVDNGTMPPGKPKLTSAEKDTLKRWIEGGAK